MLSPGTRLGTYEIVATIGAGGMGEVYRARDLKLGRDVAIKALPPVFASDPGRLTRFEREAQTLAALNDPHIAQIYGVVELPADAGSQSALVMELVEGDDVAQRIARGPVPVDEAVAIATQIAEALEAAHDLGIIHRDLKPANVKVRPDGMVKVLDFGLAKALAGDPAAAGAAISNSPTFTSPMTQLGVILGTAAYMAPEQARGKTVDRRADIWAFGVVLFEMLAGRAAFASETVTDTMSAVISRDPDWAALPQATPQNVRRLLRRCLEKDPRKRLQAIGEARIALGGGDADERPAPAQRRSGLTTLSIALVAGVAAGGTATWWLMRDLPVHAPAAPAHLEMSVAPAETLSGRFAISSDGTMVAFVGAVGKKNALYLRRLDRDEAVQLADVEVSAFAAPTFSPDGKWVAFNGYGALRKVPVDGGTATVLAPSDSSNAFRPAWGPDDTIVFSNPAFGLSRVRASGGEPEVITTVNTKAAETMHEMPLFLPDGRTILYDVNYAAAGGGTNKIFAQALDGGPRRELFEGMVLGMVGDDQLIVGLPDRIVSIPFDPVRLTARGEPSRILADVTGMSRSRLFIAPTPLAAIARNGMVVYQPGRAGDDRRALMIVDRTGAATKIDVPPHVYSDPRVSPDGTRIVVHDFDEGRDNWLIDLRRGTLTRMTFDRGEDETPIWSPDGRWIYWTATRTNVARGIFRRLADGSGPEELLWKGETHLHLGSMTPDGGSLIICLLEARRSSISTLRLADKKVTPIVATAFSNTDPALSPDGRWLAYVSDESGRDEVYVQPYPSMGARFEVSTDGGTQPVWSRRERRLYYRGSNKLMAVDYPAGDTFAASAPHAVIDDPYDTTQGGGHTAWDVTPDGRFVFIAKPAIAQTLITHLKVLLPR